MHDNPADVRGGDRDPATLSELAASIRAAGILPALTVIPVAKTSHEDAGEQFVVYAEHRRRDAARLAAAQVHVEATQSIDAVDRRGPGPRPPVRTVAAARSPLEQDRPWRKHLTLRERTQRLLGEDPLTQHRTTRSYSGTQHTATRRLSILTVAGWCSDRPAAERSRAAFPAWSASVTSAHIPSRTCLV